MKKTLIFLPLFLGILLIISSILIPPVSATTSYYNHLQNPSFVYYTDYIEDGSFESGEFQPVVEYGNFSGTGSYELNYPNTGLYNIQLDSDEYLDYNLTTPLLGSDIVYAGFYGKMVVNVNINVTFFYDDDTHSSNASYAVNTWYTEVYFTDLLTVAKTVVMIRILRASGGVFYLDDMVLLVDDGDGQDSISATTKPWGISGSRSPIFSASDVLDIVDDFGRLDSYSLRYENEDGLGAGQGIQYLDTDLIHFVDCYVYTADSTELYIECYLTYSDGSYDTKYEYFNTNGTWTYINFGQSWISEGKLIKSCFFFVSVYNSFTGTHHAFDGKIYIDDVGIWSTVEYGFTRFSFSIIPFPIESGISYFKTYCQTTYTMNINIYNSTSGEMDEEGDWYLSDAFGSQSGEMENGFFQITLNKRTYTISPYTLETIALTVITNSSVFNVELLSYWYSIEGGSVTDLDSTVTSDFMFLFIFIVIPSMFLAVILKSVGIPVIGFLAGLTIMSSIGNIVGIINVWFLFVMVLVCALLILAMLKKGMYT